jgi:hypothetical protein
VDSFLAPRRQVLLMQREGAFLAVEAILVVQCSEKSNLKWPTRQCMPATISESLNCLAPFGASFGLGHIGNGLLLKRKPDSISQAFISA